jgi:hypothetical protein
MPQFTVGTKLNIPKCALLVELGWEPINDLHHFIEGNFKIKTSNKFFGKNNKAWKHV